jgi:hypothetical protein
MLDGVHGIDSTRFQLVTNHLDSEGSNTVQHQNTVFHAILKFICNSPGRSGGIDFADQDIGFFLKGLDQAPALLPGGGKHTA